MGGFRVILAATNVALVAAMALTFDAAHGWSRRHDDVAYLAVAALGVLAWPLLRRRRVASWLLATLGAWSLATGLVLVYVTPYVGHARWMRWWHGVTSAAFAVAFVAHWARNNPRLVGLAKRLVASPRAALALTVAWGTLVAFGAATFWTPLGDAFTDAQFPTLSTMALLAFGGLGLQWAFWAPRSPRFRERLRDDAFRNRVRGVVDASLLPAMWLATLTGFTLIYLTRPLRAADAYWLGAWWHVATSALLVGLVAVHLSFNARVLVAHARRIDSDVARRIHGPP